MCFRLLMEYHSFLFNDTSLYLKDFTSNFPSPCGVIFILTLLKFKDLYRNREKEEFPSPYRVSFILIIESVTNRLENPKFIFRLLMELYSFLLKNLRSDENDNKSFRLLTELYSFLPHCLNLIRLGGRLVSVSLWSIIYSYKKGAE